MESTWDGIREELRRSIPDFKFHLWIDPLRPDRIDRRTVFLRAPEHVRTWVTERYLPLLREAATSVLGEAAAVEIVGEDCQLDNPPGAQDAGADASGGRHLNPKLTFEQFVIGDGNRLAHAASLTVAELPGQAYNPLFIHGAAGTGKTHLLHAIGHYVSRYEAGIRVRCASVDEFTREFVDAVRRRDAEPFKKRFRGVDLLLIDDVQFLADRIQTKEEFFHTFNALHDAGRQLVLTSDRSPTDLTELEARLTGRLASGLVVELEPPDFETRLAILRKRARLDAINPIDEGTLTTLAGAATTSVRELEGLLIRVVAYSSLRGVPLTTTAVERLVCRMGSTPRRTTQLTEIQEATAETFGVSRDRLLSRDRSSNLAFARQVAMYLARELTDQSFPEIARQFGGRNHTTVLHAHRNVRNRISDDAEAARTVRKLRQAIDAKP